MLTPTPARARASSRSKSTMYPRPVRGSNLRTTLLCTALLLLRTKRNTMVAMSNCHGMSDDGELDSEFVNWLAGRSVGWLVTQPTCLPASLWCQIILAILFLWEVKSEQKWWSSRKIKSGKVSFDLDLGSSFSKGIWANGEFLEVTLIFFQSLVKKIRSY